MSAAPHTDTTRSVLRVLQSFPAPRATTNPYISMLDGALAAEPGIEHLRFSWRTALLGRYDVIHFHWPETLFSASSRLKATGKHLAFLALLARLRMRRIAVVRTVHNLHLPTDVTASQRRILERVEQLTTLRILIGETTRLPEGQPSATILHGHYRDWFASYPRSAPTPGRIGFVGLIRRYKGVEQLIAAFRGRPPARAELRLAVSGQPTSEALADELRALAAGDEAIALAFGFLDDAAFVEAMTASGIVVLPYRFMHNSGSVLAALSLDRPVLVPRNEANEALAVEVGAGWIHSYDDELDTPALLRAVDAVTAAPPEGSPDLTRREWTDTGARHLDAYRRAVRIRHGEPE